MVTIKLDKERHLRLALRGMLAYEKMIGKSLFKGFDIKTMSTREISVLLWACSIDEDRELKYEDFIDIVEVGHIPELTEAVSQCILESFPDTKGKERGTSPLAQKSRRLRSG